VCAELKSRWQFEIALPSPWERPSPPPNKTQWRVSLSSNGVPAPYPCSLPCALCLCPVLLLLDVAVASAFSRIACASDPFLCLSTRYQLKPNGSRGAGGPEKMKMKATKKRGGRRASLPKKIRQKATDRLPPIFLRVRAMRVSCRWTWTCRCQMPQHI
jgi:hypothetical protein